MTENLLIGCCTMGICLTIQCLFVSALLRCYTILQSRNLIRPTLLWSILPLAITLLTMLVGNLLQMAIWGGLFISLGEFHEFGTAFYHSVVNFSTLGYGDVVMSEPRRLLGGLEAANGVMMFGLTTSILYAVLHELMSSAWEQHAARPEPAK